MNYETVALITLFGSIIGIGVVLIRKMPILRELPEVVEKPFFNDLFLKTKKIFSSKSFSLEVFLQKTLSKIRILSLKTDNKVTDWLQRSKERSQKKKEKTDDNYWQEIKESTKK